MSRLAGRRFGALGATVLATIGLAVASPTAFAHERQWYGQTGPHNPAGVTCYQDGTLAIAPDYGRISIQGDEWVSYRIIAWNATTRTYSNIGGWYPTWYFGHEDVFLSETQRQYLPRAVPQGNYYIGVLYAWYRRGVGWTMDFSWTWTYLLEGDFFGTQSNYCRAQPTIVTVP